MTKKKWMLLVLILLAIEIITIGFFYFFKYRPKSVFIDKIAYLSSKIISKDEISNPCGDLETIKLISSEPSSDLNGAGVNFFRIGQFCLEDIKPISNNKVELKLSYQSQNGTTSVLIPVNMIISTLTENGFGPRKVSNLKDYVTIPSKISVRFISSFANKDFDINQSAQQTLDFFAFGRKEDWLDYYKPIALQISTQEEIVTKILSGEKQIFNNVILDQIF